MCKNLPETTFHTCNLPNAFMFSTAPHRDDRVTISLLSNDTLIIIEDLDSNKYERVLSREAGDFECDGDGIIVRNLEGRFWLISADTAQLTRTFNRCTDGSIVMKDEVKMGGWHAFVPLIHHHISWVKWKPVSEP